MSTPKLPVHSTICIMLLPLLSACGAYQTSGVSPAPSRLASVTTASGAVLVFDTLPAPQIVGDTVYGHRDGVSYAIPKAEIAATRWVVLPSERPVSETTAEPNRPTPGEPPRLAAGAHVRITAPSLGWDGKTADLADVRGDTLLLRRVPIFWFRRSPKPVPLSAVTALEVSRNHGEHVGALTLGGLAGMVAGGFAGYALYGSCPSSSGVLDFSYEVDRAGAVLLGMAVGDGIGLLIANAAVPERWEATSLGGAHVGLVIEPGGRVGLGFSLPL